jgi:hypothetical protein
MHRRLAGKDVSVKELLFSPEKRNPMLVVILQWNHLKYNCWQIGLE